MTDTKVLFIIGKGRSGSTLIDNALGQVPGFFSAGEIWRRWKWQPLDRYPCGCGHSLSECPIWSEAIGRTQESLRDDFGSATTLADAVAWEKAVLRWRGLGRLLADRVRLKRWPALDNLVRFASILYRSLARAADARVIVDSTKWPLHPGPLGLIPNIEAFALHLVRDPRAVAFSWQREKYYPAFEEPMQRFGPVHSAVSWDVRNAASEFTVRFLRQRALRIRYEDFAAHPKSTFTAILRLTGEHPDRLPFVDERTLALESTHTVMGNPSRFQAGTVEVQADVEWRSGLGRSDRLIVTLLTFPLLWRYRYRLRAAEATPIR